MIAGEWMFSFSSLDFSLVYLVGLVSQSSDIGFHTRVKFKRLSTTYEERTFQQTTKKIKHSYSRNVQVAGDSDHFREFEQTGMSS